MKNFKLVKDDHGIEYAIFANNSRHLTEIIDLLKKYKSIEILSVDEDELNISLNVNLKMFKNFKSSDIFNNLRFKNYFEYYQFKYSLELDKSKYQILKNKICKAFEKQKFIISFDNGILFSLYVLIDLEDLRNQDSKESIRNRIKEKLDKVTKSILT